MFVFSNLATSLDGKIATAKREVFLLGTPYDRDRMQVLRKQSDVVLMGASTLRTHRRFCGLRGTPRRQPANAILSTDLAGISPDWPFFQDPGVKRLLFVTGKPSAAAVRRFARTSEVIPLRADSQKGRKAVPIARQIIAALAARGYRKLLVEGGGGLMWDFARENLIDEYHVTLTPRILGGTEAPTLVDGAGFDPEHSLQLRLKRCRRVGDELYLTYEKRSR